MAYTSAHALLTIFLY